MLWNHYDIVTIETAARLRGLVSVTPLSQSTEKKLTTHVRPEPLASFGTMYPYGHWDTAHAPRGVQIDIAGIAVAQGHDDG